MLLRSALEGRGALCPSHEREVVAHLPLLSHPPPLRLAETRGLAADILALRATRLPRQACCCVSVAGW